MMQKIALIGGGGHARVIINLLHACNQEQPQYELVGIYDDSEATEILGLPRLGTLADLASHDQTVQLLTALGNNGLREKIATTYSQLTFATLIHPTAIIKSDVHFGEGTVVMAGCIIQANTTIGNHCIINTGAILDHDVRIGHYSHIAQRVTLTGGVQIGTSCLLNAGTIVAPWQIINDETILPIGSQIG